MNPYLNPLNAAYLENLAEDFATQPDQLDPSWRYFFSGFSAGQQAAQGEAPPISNAQVDLEFERKVLELIKDYRTLGYLIADVNPLRRGVKLHPLLKLEKFGLSASDLDRHCESGKLLGLTNSTLREIISALARYYFGTASVEYGHIDDPRSRQWIQRQIESNYLTKELPKDVQLRAYRKLLEADLFESFLQKRFVGQKRFSVEGNDVVISILDFIIQRASQLGADEIIIGMAHRGRLNVLANIFHKDLQKMMGEFSGNLDANVGDGDVKYHMGFSQTHVTPEGKQVHLSLMPNPSHLEAVNSVLMGVTRAKQTLKEDTQRTRTLAVLLHGDAAFAGQGSVYECLNLAELKHYSVGGTIHLIVNNQIGFTTSPQEGRSTPQCTDLATMMDFPIFHVNADDPDAALRVADLALRFRYDFQQDVLIDVVGYRRYGHNEADEPSFTQPLMYHTIQNHPRVRIQYENQLIGAGLLSAEQVQGLEAEYNAKLESALEESRKTKVSPMMPSFSDRWQGLNRPSEADVFAPCNSEITSQQLEELGKGLLKVPEGFKLHPKVQRFLEERRAMVAGERGVDWSLGEALSFASLLKTGTRVRLAGQDSERGTFSQRHSVLHEVDTGRTYCSLNHLDGEQAEFEVVNSPLSEYAALGFEFGQSIANPHKLVLWEAQFGDFVNGAQIIVDQFLVSSAFKWNRYSGLVMLLPHGYEGQGPEHSSAYLHRFLQACAQNNIQVCNLTTPAQIFHVLRRQMIRNFRLPLVIMSPKSLLRHPLAVSSLQDFSEDHFHEILDDQAVSSPEKIKRLVFCSGKIYYDLLQGKRDNSLEDVALVRVEQIYPFPTKRYQEILEKYSRASDVVWCQEGPKNMESWGFMLQFLSPLLKANQTLRYAGRAPQASPADSFLSIHQQEQKRVVQEALGIIKS